MRIALPFLLLWFGTLSHSEEALPKITPALVAEIQRLAITIRIAEFPLSQQEFRKQLAVPPFHMGMGIGGKGIRSHQICKLSDPNDPLGYYGFNIYWGKRQTVPPFAPLVEGIELFFQPGNMGGYPPTPSFVLPKDTPQTFDPVALADLRAKMRERHLTPGEFVKEWYKNRQGVSTSKLSNMGGPDQSSEPTRKTGC